MLENLGKRHRDRASDIFLLANNFHSLEGSDLYGEDVNILLERVDKEWNKYRAMLSKNNNTDYALSMITNLDVAREVAYLTLYTKEQIRRKCGV